MYASPKTRQLPSGKASSGRPDALVARFHGALFGRAPELERLLPVESEDYLEAISPLLMEMIVHTRDVEALDRAIAGFMEIYCVHYGLQSPHTQMLAQAVLDVIAAFLGPRWNPALARTVANLIKHHLEAMTSPRPRLTREAAAAPLAVKPPTPVIKSPPLEAISSPAPVVALPMTLDRSREGMLLDRPLAQLLHRLKISKWKGRLALSVGQLRQQIDVLDGEPGTCQGDGRAARAHLMGAFAWKDGTYRLDPDVAIDPSAFIGFGDADRVSLEAILKHMSINDLGHRLSPWLKHYPARTDGVEARIKELEGANSLARLCAMCDGKQTLEALLQTTWIDVRAALGSACFAMDTQLLIFQPQATNATLKLEYINIRPANAADALIGPGERRHKLMAVEAKAARQRNLMPGALQMPYSSEPRGVTTSNHANVPPEAPKENCEHALAPRPPRQRERPRPSAEPPVQNKIQDQRTEPPVRNKIHDQRTEPPVQNNIYNPRTEPPVRNNVHDPRMEPPFRNNVHNQRTEPPVQNKTHDQRSEPPVRNNIHDPRTEPPVRNNVHDPRMEPPVQLNIHDLRNGPVQNRIHKSSGQMDDASGARMEPSPPRGPRRAAAPPSPPQNPSEAVPNASSWDSNLPLGEGVVGVTVQDHLRHGQRMLDMGSPQRALVSFGRAFEMSPNNVEVQAKLAWAQYLCEASRIKTIDNSLEDLLKTPGNDSKARELAMSQVHLVRGRIAKARGDDEEALKHFKRALASDPGCVEASREERLYHMRQNKEGERSWFEKLMNKR